MTHVNPLNPLLGKLEKFEQSDEQVRQWESARVEWTLRRLKLEPQRKEILAASVAGQYSFSELRRVVGNFPLRLVAEPFRGELPLHRDSRSIHPMWFKAFRGLPFVQRYEELYEELSASFDGKPFGMVFPRKGFAQGLVLHNGDWDLFVPPQASCHIFKGGKRHAMTLLVQPYSGLVDHIREGLGWVFEG
jgi:hypothetical protein